MGSAGIGCATNSASSGRPARTVSRRPKHSRKWPGLTAFLPISRGGRNRQRASSIGGLSLCSSGVRAGETTASRGRSSRPQPNSRHPSLSTPPLGITEAGMTVDLKPARRLLPLAILLASAGHADARGTPSADHEARLGQCIRQAAGGRAWLEKTLWGLRDQEGGWIGAQVPNGNGTHDL